MKVKRYFSHTMQDALRQVREDLGPDAVILSNSKHGGGVEILATTEYQEQDEHIEVSAKKENVVGPSELARQRAHKSIRLQEELNKSRQKIDAVKTKRTDGEKTTVRHTEKVTQQSYGESALKSMQDELRELRALITRQQVSANVEKEKALSPVQEMLKDKLENLQIQKPIREKLVGGLSQESDAGMAWAKSRKQIFNAMQTEYSEIIDMGGVISLVGPTGSGKTMTIGKLAARYVMRHGADSIALVTTDRYRIAAHEQLKVFGRILNVPVHVVDDDNCLDAILDKCSDRKLVLIDTAGLMQSDKCWNEQLKELKMSAHRIHNYLVVPATGQYAVMKANFKHYKMVGLAGTIITKLDEAVSLGEVISYLISSKLPCAYFTDGQRVPEDIHLANKKELINKAEALLNSSERWVTIPSQETRPERFVISDTA